MDNEIARSGHWLMVMVSALCFPQCLNNVDWRRKEKDRAAYPQERKKKTVRKWVTQVHVDIGHIKMNGKQVGRMGSVRRNSVSGAMCAFSLVVMRCLKQPRSPTPVQTGIIQHYRCLSTIRLYHSEMH